MLYSKIKTNPKPMNYWKIITTIANYNNVDLKEAVKKYYNLTGIPNKKCYEAIINLDVLLPCCKVEVTNNTDILDSLNIPHRFAGLKSYIIDIDITVEKTGEFSIAYLLSDGRDFFFSSKMLRRLE